MVDTPDLATAMEWIAAHQKVHSVTLFYPDFGDESMPLHEMKALASVGSDGRIVVHTGTDLFEPFRQYPRRYTGTAAAANIETFVAHVVRFKDEDSAIWCNNDPSNPTLTAILDYHMARNVDPGFTDDTKKEPLPLPGAHAQFGQHRTVYKFPLSVEWKAWSAAAGKPMDAATVAAACGCRSFRPGAADENDPGRDVREHGQARGIVPWPQAPCHVSRGADQQPFIGRGLDRLRKPAC